MTVLTLIHVVTGTAALLSGMVAAIAPKGQRMHTLSGKVFFYSMAIIAITAVWLSLQKSNYFLLGIGIFSFYLAFTGVAVLQRKRKELWRKLNAGVVLLAGIAGLGLLAIGLNMLNVIPMVFGSITLLMVLTDVRSRNKTLRGSERIVFHIGRIMGAYIATWTAFLVNTVHIQPDWVLWLGPTVIGSIFISFWIRRWKMRSRVAVAA